ncbi:unnamed protein product, partial [Hapterophycus canaliculatus]
KFEIECEPGSRNKAKQKTISDAQWLDSNPGAEEEDLTAKLKEVESVANPIIARAYEAGDGGAGGEDAGDEGMFSQSGEDGDGDQQPAEPHVEEVD